MLNAIQRLQHDVSHRAGLSWRRILSKKMARKVLPHLSEPRFKTKLRRIEMNILTNSTGRPTEASDCEKALAHFDQLALEAEPPFSDIELAVIAFAQSLEPDPDFEAWLAYTPQSLTGLKYLAPSNLIDLEADDSELEPSLGWANGSQHFIQPWAGPSVEVASSSEHLVDCEQDNCDLEHSDNGDFSYGETHGRGVAKIGGEAVQ